MVNTIHQSEMWSTKDRSVNTVGDVRTVVFALHKIDCPANVVHHLVCPTHEQQPYVIGTTQSHS